MFSSTVKLTEINGALSQDFPSCKNSAGVEEKPKVHPFQRLRWGEQDSQAHSFSIAGVKKEAKQAPAPGFAAFGAAKKEAEQAPASIFAAFVAAKKEAEQPQASSFVSLGIGEKEA